VGGRPLILGGEKIYFEEDIAGPMGLAFDRQNPHKPRSDET